MSFYSQTNSLKSTVDACYAILDRNLHSRAGMDIRCTGKKGHHKLTDFDKEAICFRRAQYREHLKSLAECFGVSVMTVQRVLKDKQPINQG